MGAENSILENCKWDDVISTSSGTDWSLRHATLRDDTTVSVFQHKKKDKKEVDLLHRGTKNLRTLRHPNLLRFVASGENSDGSYLVTEQVQPLENCLPSLHPLEMCAGLQSILEALLFLHDTVGITHNNVCLSSVYVTIDGTWKLGGLEHSCKFQEASEEFLDKCLAFRNEDTISPEEKQGNISATADLGHARDVFAFGVFAEQLLEKLEELGDLIKTFELRVQDECLNVDPSQRPHVQSLLNDRVFRHDFLEVLQFVRNVTTKTEEEKEEFFRIVSVKLLTLPEELVARSLAIPLLSRFVMLDETANKFMLPNLLSPYKEGSRPKIIQGGQPTPILSADLFKVNIIPELFRIFHIRDAHIRMVLLTHFAAYVDLFDAETLEDVIFPQLLIGLRDTDDRIVAASLRCLSYLVPLLGGDLIIGGPRKKFFTEGMPKFNLHGRDEEKNRKKMSVSGIMGKKMLLKDLATLSSTNNGSVISGNDEKEAKKRERERRKEEARLRREERKKKLQENKKNENNKASISDVQSSKLDDAQTKEVIHDDDIHEVSDQDNRTGQNVEEKADWSDWEDDKTDKNNSVQTDDLSFDEDQFSDEIENELRSMPSTVPHTSPSDKTPYISTPSVDWSDTVTRSACDNNESRQSRTKGALRLGQSKSKSAENKSESKVVPVKSDSSEWGETWDDIDPNDTQTDASSENMNSSSISKQSPSRMNKKTVMKTNIPKRTSDLGSEFNIKVIPVKKISTSSEPDFFTDMMPEIKVGHKDPLSEFAGQTETGMYGRASDSPKKKTIKSVSFAVTDAVESQEAGDGSGWGDDLDWGTEDI